MKLGERPLEMVSIRVQVKRRAHVLIHDDAHSIIQQTFSKDDSIQLRVNFVLVENGKDCNRVGCR